MERNPAENQQLGAALGNVESLLIVPVALASKSIQIAGNQETVETAVAERIGRKATILYWTKSYGTHAWLASRLRKRVKYLQLIVHYTVTFLMMVSNRSLVLAA